jgi:hypothetical protein
VGDGYHTIYRGRTFFGPLRVDAADNDTLNRFVHGKTLHGAQFRGARRGARRLPLTYYFPTGPVGQVFEVFKGKWARARIAVVGLGAGSLATYGQPGQEFTFFEIDPMVEVVARRHFTYLAESRARCRVVVGDGRLALAQEPDGYYDLIVLDAFSSDAVPTHLLTREALALYKSKLAPEGVLLVNITNSYLDLEPVVAGVAEANGLVARAQVDTEISPLEARLIKFVSQWMVVARAPEHLGPLLQHPRHRHRWQPASRKGHPVWSDDFSNILGIVLWL